MTPQPFPPLVDHRGQPLRVIGSPGDAQRVAVLYPGLNYGLQAPLFFYLAEALEREGWAVMAIDYRYNENQGFLTASDKEKDRWFLADSLAVGTWIASRTGGSRVAHVAKSLGTSMLMHQAKAGLLSRDADLVWLTPGSSAAEQFQLIPRLVQRSLVAYGTSDPHYLKAASFRPTSSPLVTLVEVVGAGHVFEAEGDIERSLLNVAHVVRAILTFLQEER